MIDTILSGIGFSICFLVLGLYCGRNIIEYRERQSQKYIKALEAYNEGLKNHNTLLTNIIACYQELTVTLKGE